jgi:hypothetical protein
LISGMKISPRALSDDLILQAATRNRCAAPPTMDFPARAQDAKR